MNVLGIDFSSSAIDLVYLQEDADIARWHRIPLEPGWQGVRKIRHSYAWAGELEGAGVYLVALEQPMSSFRNSIAALNRIQGGILCSLPLELDVWLLAPGEWHAGIGLGRNVSTQKDPGRAALVSWALPHGADESWPVDACAALAMAHTARGINERAVRLAVAAEA